MSNPPTSPPTKTSSQPPRYVVVANAGAGLWPHVVEMIYDSQLKHWRAVQENMDWTVAQRMEEEKACFIQTFSTLQKANEFLQGALWYQRFLKKMSL